MEVREEIKVDCRRIIPKNGRDRMFGILCYSVQIALDCNYLRVMFEYYGAYVQSLAMLFSSTNSIHT